MFLKLNIPHKNKISSFLPILKRDLGPWYASLNCDKNGHLTVWKQLQHRYNEYNIGIEALFYILTCIVTSQIFVTIWIQQSHWAQPFTRTERRDIYEESSALIKVHPTTCSIIIRQGTEFWNDATILFWINVQMVKYHWYLLFLLCNRFKFPVIIIIVGWTNSPVGIRVKKVLGASPLPTQRRLNWGDSSHKTTSDVAR